MIRRLTNLLLLILATLMLAATTISAQDSGKIEDFEAEVEDSGDNDSSSDNNDSGHHHHYHSSGGDDWFFAEVFFRAFVMFPNEDSVLYGGPASFNAYPFANNTKGWYNYYNETDTRKIAMNFTANQFYDSAELTGIGLRGRVMITPYASITGNYTHLTETLEKRKDHVEFYSAFANFNRLRLEAVTFWWGAGIKGMRGSSDHLGPALNAGMDVFITRPVSVHGNYSVGSLNSQAVSEIYLRLNAHIDRAVAYIGYQDFRVGQVAISGFIYGIGIHL